MWTYVYSQIECPYFKITNTHVSKIQVELREREKERERERESESVCVAVWYRK